MKPTVIEQLDYLFNPRSVAVIGASNTFGKWGFNIFRGVLRKNRGVKIYPINKNEQEVLGVKSYGNINEVPGPVDIAVILIPAQGTPAVIEDCVKKGVKVAVIISSGFAESEKEGARIEKEIAGIARKGGMRLVGPNCMGHFNASTGLSTTLPFPFKQGEIGLISQSGNFGAYIVHCGQEIGIGFSKFITTGNEVDLRFEDYLEYLAQDEETKVIAAYIEGLREVRRFFQLAKEITKRKPIVAIKSGRTATGAKAARSHTGALAGEDTIYDAAFKQTGVIRVEDATELVDIASGLLRQPLPKGRRVGILTGGGGYGVVATDVCERLGLDIAPLSQDTTERLKTILPSYSSIANPVDTATSALLTYPSLWALLEDENLDAVLALTAIGFSIPVGGTSDSVPHSMREEFERTWRARDANEVSNLGPTIERMDKYHKPLVISILTTESRKNSQTFAKLQENDIQIYPSPERAAKVLAHLAWYSDYLSHSQGGDN